MTNRNGVVGYDVETLKRGLETIRDNIVAIEAALQSEREKEREYERLLADARAILTLHGVGDDGRPN